MSESEYFLVTQLLAVAEQFTQLAGTAYRLSLLPQYVRSARWIHEELRRTPLEFGEGRYSLPIGRFLYRIAIVRPIAVDFAVDAVNRIVYYRQFRLLDQSDTSPPAA